MTDDIPATLANIVAQHADLLIALSEDIHARPELAFAEEYAADRLATMLADNGFAVTRGAYDLPTAFEATVGTGEFRAVLCAEYDALPQLGHACGHNMIAAIAVGTALALAEVADDLDLQVVVLGTPAEEHGGGKCLLLERGAFASATIASMVHACAGDAEVSAARVSMMCVDRFDIEFTGRTAHSAGAPHEGVNAGDAASLMQVAVGLARQQFRDGVRVTAITADGGTVTNVIPGSARVAVEVRCATESELDVVRTRVLACARGAAIATGCEWSSREVEPRYLRVTPDPDLAARWDANITAAGRIVDVEREFTSASTDMGNVSQAVPSLHAMLTIPGATSPPHSPDFADEAIGERANETIRTAATVQAQTVADVARDSATRARLRERSMGAR